jgi:DinB superfamily
MTARQFARPGADEHAPYYGSYIDKVPAGHLLELLQSQIGEITAVLDSLGEAKGNHAYGPGKWTIKEIVGHLADTERVMTYRLLSFARRDPNPLPSFDENAWVPPARFNDRTLASLVAELLAVRYASLALLGGLPAGVDANRGTASNREISVRALGHILYGHVAHHLGVIKERYL